MSTSRFLLGIDSRPPSPTQSQLNQIRAVAEIQAAMDYNQHDFASSEAETQQSEDMTSGFDKGQIVHVLPKFFNNY